MTDSPEYRLLRIFDHEKQTVSNEETGKAIAEKFPYAARPFNEWASLTFDAAKKAAAYENGPLFVLARTLKGGLRSDLKEVDFPHSKFFPYALLFVEIMDYWDLGPVYCNFDGDFDPSDDDELDIMFETVWGQVKFGLGDNLLELARQHSQNIPNGKFPDITNEKVKQLAAMAGYLQSKNPDQPILLPQDRLAEGLGVSQPLISAGIEKLIKLGYLTKVADAVHLQGKAASYRFKEVSKKPSRRNR